ncbi:hypothetical protein METBIDRAFT_39390 [Metschnikowia bicuspidata var. bicuspidata NRRL YB-4993]|uniref:Uncharacterized protein n=1 Tax=Metschnikowia bicuspidata var. bicuspidata NRRL YB-4993 TaxID=869754 RepID=A0A1A0HE66_9ASCO|nr:hypothetical protein METBIDRAFT_39390 [Metschnikowia bicuspidata var. bicuspidata NRRL YB-4993]OBA22286.1 hypothetical protein METBIDRAFT_39390 [Metschnikowia bicuspidata var. bicuspidata NRRL YB-4993]
MARKFLLGAAAVGAGVYLYDQNVQPIFPRDNKGNAIGVSQAAPPKELKDDFHKLGEDTKDLGSQLKKTVNSSVSDVRHKTDDAVSSIKDSEMYNKWSQKLDNYQKDVQTEAEAINNKPLPNRLAAKYHNFVNSLGQTEDEKLKELASSTSARQQEIKKDLAREQQSWSSWWSGKKNDAENKKDELTSAAEKEKNSWFKWGQKEADNAEAKLQKEKSSWVNWADDKSDEAKKTAEDAKKEKNKWVSWGSTKADEAERAAKDAQNDLEAKKNGWVNWGSAKADEAQQRAREGHNDLRATLNDQSQHLSENYEQAKNKALEDYEAARKNLENWSQQAKEKANGVWSRADEEHLKRAGDDFQSAFGNLKRFGEELTSRK